MVWFILVDIVLPYLAIGIITLSLAKEGNDFLAKENALIPIVKYLNRFEDKSQNNQESQQE
jgi:hypothetical protein